MCWSSFEAVRPSTGPLALFSSFFPSFGCIYLIFCDQSGGKEPTHCVILNWPTFPTRGFLGAASFAPRRTAQYMGIFIKFWTHVLTGTSSSLLYATVIRHFVMVTAVVSPACAPNTASVTNALRFSLILEITRRRSRPEKLLPPSSRSSAASHYRPHHDTPND